MADDASQVLEKIWADWYNGEGPCGSCPGRDMSGCHTPYFGDGTFPAEIAFVAETPGGSRPTQTESPDDPCWESVPETHAEKNQGVGWLNSGNRIPDKFFSEFLGQEYGFTDKSDIGIYFTNAKKCANIVGEDEGWKDEKARIDCRAHLKPEIEAVDPTVIVPFGAKSTDALYRVFDVDRNVRKMTAEVLNTYQNNSRYIVPSYHWSGLPRNITNLESISDTDEYWAILADKITAVV